ncbi:MAG: nucleotidyltransferase [Parcubacteria group bacterium]
MPYTVPVCFDKFRENIELSGNHRDTANKRKDDIVSSLKNDFTILEAFPSGSIPRYTAVTGYADLDVIVVLHYSKHIKDKKPSQVLQNVRDALAECKTNVRKNGQAVTLHYKTWPNVDIVPVSRTTNSDDSVNHYNVPDMNNEAWLQSRPRKHSNAMSDKNKVCGEYFKRIVKMIKWWNHQHSSFLQSFHIEVIALKAFNGELSDYPWDVFQYFNKATDLVKSPLWHEGDYIDDYLDDTKRYEAVKRLETARDKAHEAWSCTYGDCDDHEKAINLWRQIFKDKFPAYGS